MIFANISFGQNYFNLRYGTDSIPDIGVTLLAVDTGYYVVDISFYNSYKTMISLSYLDSLGNLVWRKSYGSQGKYFTGGRTGKQLILSPDKSKVYYACSVIDSSNRNFGALWSFNRQGDSLWCKYYGDSLTFYSNNHCQITSDSCIIITGAMNNGTTQAMLIKTDSLGNKIWEQNFGGTGTEYGCSVLQTPDGGYMMGITTTSFGGDVDMAVIKTDSNGSQQWLQPYSGNFSEADINYLISLSDGNYALCGALGSSTSTYSWPRLIKITPIGGVIWDKKYGNLSWSGALCGIIEENETGNIIGSGTKDSKGYILKVNQNGDSLWQRLVHHPSVNYFGTTNILWAIDTTFNGGYIGAGVIYPLSPDTGSTDAWVIKVDEYGCDTLNCQFVSVVENEMEIGMIRVYPNPTNADLNLEIDAPLFKNEFLIAEFYDITGKMLFAKLLNSTFESLDIASYPNGIYLLLIKSEEKIIDEIKIVKE